MGEKFCLNYANIGVTVILLIEDKYSSETALEQFPSLPKSRIPEGCKDCTQMCPFP